MKLIYSTLLLSLLAITGTAQKRSTYLDSIIAYQKKYTVTHEVVKATDRKFFRFYPVNKNFLTQCQFKKSMDSTVVRMNTSGKTIPQKDFFLIEELIERRFADMAAFLLVATIRRGLRIHLAAAAIAAA